MSATVRRRLALPLSALVVLVLILPAARRPTATPGDDCTADCFTCSGSTWAIINVGTPNDYHNFPYPCVDVKCPCPCLPLPCNPGGDPAAPASPTIFGLVANVERAATVGDVEFIAQTVASDKRFELNESRGAFQVIGCNESVAATVQIGSEVLHAVQNVLSSPQSH